MDFLNKALAQLSAAFRALSPAGRITTGVLLAVLAVSSAYLFNHQLSVGEGYLFGGEAVSATQLPAIEAAFGKKNLTDYELQGNRIRVPQGKQALYMAALADAGALPHNFLDSLKNSLDSCGPFVDRKKREELVKVALQDELAKIIGQMNGIQRATVLYNVDAPQGFNAKKQITAGVTVKPIGNQTLTTEQVQMIRQAVGPAIGAAPESIAIVDINGRAYPAGAEADEELAQDRYLSAKHQYEREYADSIRQSLTFVKGAVVTVNVELHPEREASESTDQVEPKSTAGDAPENATANAAGIGLPGGIMSVATQGGIPNSPLTVAQSGNGLRTETDLHIRRERDLPSRQSRQMGGIAPTPKSVTVCISVPSSYYEEVCRQRYPSPAGAAAKKTYTKLLAQIENEVNDNIKRTVLGIIPAPDVPAGDTVTVTSFASMPIAEIEILTPADHVLMWLTDHANAVGIGLLVVVSLLIVRSIVRSLTVNRGTQESSIAPNQLVAERMAEEPHQSGMRRRPGARPLPRSELAEIVREDPDAAANVLRNWIGSAN